MSSSTKYFQLTPDVLVEYNYNNLSSINDQTDSDGVPYIKDMDNNAFVISNGYCGIKSFLWNEYEDTYVLPINKSESKFIQYKNAAGTKIEDWNIDFGSEQIFYTSGNIDKEDILCDTFRLHFTGRNFLGNNDYDGFIISVYVYDTVKNKVGLLSQYIKKTTDPNINENPVLINQKLYTTYMDFTIPNVYAINCAKSRELETILPGEETLRNKLFSTYDIMNNSPMVMNIYGVKSTIENNQFEYYTTEKINSIYIPIIDKSNSLVIDIDEANDGDYFIIKPEVDSGLTSFSDYIYNLSLDENGGNYRPELYIVFHELVLTEYEIDGVNKLNSRITHREQFIMNAAYQTSTTDGETTTNVNETELDDVIFYRPILRKCGKNVGFTIEVTTNIINRLDNTTIVKKSSRDFGPDCAKKYGKNMNRIYLGEIPSKVNVYNRRPDIDVDGVKIVNSGSSNVKIENHQHSVIGFIECSNVGVSIEQIPKELL